MSERILVTGSSGFIGGKLTERLRANGRTVVGVGRRSIESDEDYHSLDLGESIPANLDGAYSAVIHAAARSSPWGRRREYEWDNVQATRNVIDFCERNGKPKLVYISSSSVYYRARHQRDLDESSPVPEKFVNLYAETKWRGEELVRNYQGSWAILRPRAVFGPGDTVLLPRIVEAARQGRLPLLVSKTPVVGDLIYIENLVDYIERAATDPAIEGEFNLTNDQPAPILDFLLDALERLDISAPTRRVSVNTAMMGAAFLEAFHWMFLPNREPAITRFGVHVFAYSKTFDVRKCIEAMGPPRVDLDEGLRRTVEAMQAEGKDAVTR